MEKQNGETTRKVSLKDSVLNLKYAPRNDMILEVWHRDRQGR